MLVSEHTTCRICGGSLEPLLDLGVLALPAYLKPNEPDPARAPLDLVVCGTCQLVQLRHSVENDRLYRQYWYQSAINETMVAELRDVAACALEIVGTSRQSKTVLDIGANDGTLLRACGEPSDFGRLFRIAVEPAQTFADRLPHHADLVVSDYFPSAQTQNLPDRCVDICTSVAMFYDLDDPRAFVAEVDRLLAPDGLWIVQMQDLAQMIASTAYDNVCFEHRVYYATQTFLQLFAETDLEIRGVETRQINGGSLRYYITRRETRPRRFPRGRSVHGQLVAESWLTRHRLQRFASDATQHQHALVGLLFDYQNAGQAVDLYAASTKSSTLLQSCGIDHTLIRCAVERSLEKVGLVTSGTRIPIISEEAWRRDPAQVTLLGAYGFRDAVLRREAGYLEQGGAFIIPLPSIDVVRGSDVRRTA